MQVSTTNIDVIALIVVYYCERYDPRPQLQFFLRIMTPGHNVTWTEDPGSLCNVKSYPKSRFNVESRPEIMI